MAAEKPAGSRIRPNQHQAIAAWIVLLVTVAAVVGGLVVYWRAWSYHTPLGYGADLPAFLSSDALALSSAAVGLVILVRSRGNIVGWLLAALGLGVALAILGLVVAACGLARALEPSMFVGWLAGTGFQPILAALVGLLMLAYPDGRITQRCRGIAAVILAGAAIRFIEIGFASGQLFYFPMRANTFAPGGLAGRLVDLSRIHNLGLLVLFAGVLLATLCVIDRYRSAGDVERLQLRAFAATSFVLAVVGGLLVQLFLFYDPYQPIGQSHWVAFFLVASLYPIGIGFAITRYRLYEIDRIISRTFVYGTLTAILAGMFTASVTLSQKVLIALTGESSDMVIVLVTLVAAASYTPIRKRLETLAERYFKYDSPRFGAYRAHLRSTLDVLDPAEIADNLAREAMDELKAPGARVELTIDDGLEVAELGELTAEQPALVIELQGRRGPIGRLILAARTNGLPYRQDEIDSITDVAGLAGRAAELHARVPVGATTDAAPPLRTHESVPWSQGGRRGSRRPIRLAGLGGDVLGEPIPPQPLSLMPAGRRSILDPDS